MRLLDTHILLYLAAGAPLRFAEEYASGPIAVSPISAAEIACLQKLGRVLLTEAADVWFDRAIDRLGAHVLPLAAGTFARAMLLDWDHRDPADRVLVQTLIERPDLELHTRDRRILALAEARALKVRDCRL